MRRIAVADTSFLSVYLDIPGKNTVQMDGRRYDAVSSKEYVENLVARGALIVVPLGVVIETANHIANCAGDRLAIAGRLTAILVESIQARAPWAAYATQAEIWASDKIRFLIDAWPPEAVRQNSLCDISIVSVADLYRETGHAVEILSGEAWLRAHARARLPSSTRPRRP